MSRSGSRQEAARLEILSGFRLSVGGQPAALPLGAQRVIAFLAVHPRPLQRLYVAGSLWADSDEPHANASLRSALWRAQRTGAAIVLATPTHLELSPAVHVDLPAATGLLNSAVDGRGPLDPETVRRACGLGDLLPDWYEDWLAIEQERYRQLRLHALETLAKRLGSERRWPEAIQVALAAVAAEPLRESAHRLAITAHLAQGNVSEAIRQYRSYRALLRRHIGMDPSREMEALVRRALTDEPMR